MTKEIYEAEKMTAAKKETVMKQRLLDALDSDMLLSWAHSEDLKKSLGEHLTPEISEYIDGKRTLRTCITQQENIAKSMKTNFVEQANEIIVSFEDTLNSVDVEEFNNCGLRLTIRKSPPYFIISI